MASETGVHVTARDPMVTDQSTIQLIDQNLEKFKEAVVNRVTVEFQRQERLLEEAKRELAICKKALSDAECAKHDLEERFEQEKQALNDEIYQLRECGVRGLEEGFEQRKQAPSLEDAVPQLKKIVIREERVVDQQDLPPVPADTQQHAIVRKDIATA